MAEKSVAEKVAARNKRKENMKKTKKREDEARHRLLKARMTLVIMQPFFGCLALHLQVVNGDKCRVPVETLTTDGKRLYYNVDFVLDGVNDKELIGSIAHIVLHCAYRHMTRRQSHVPQKWNMAGDYVINLDLNDAHFTLPKDRLLDTAYRDMSTEEVYRKMPDLPKQPSGSKGIGVPSIGDGTSEDDNANGSPDEPDDNPNKDIGGCGTVIDAEADNPAGVAGFEMQWEALTRQAINVAAAQNAGTIPAFLKRLVDELRAPRISWKDVLREFLDGTNKSDYTFLKPNRRHIGRGFILPGLRAEGVNHMIFCGDTSASMSIGLLAEIRSEIQAAMDEGIIDKITVIYADAKVARVDEFELGDELIFDPAGGGGTDFEDTFRWIIEEADDPSAVVYFTDMYVYNFGENPGVPVLWCTYGRGRDFDTVAEQVPFGRAINVH